jgi:phosphoglycerate dehydrogenase-like enzyme
MDVLIVEPLDPEALHWLDARHPVLVAPQLERDPIGLRQALEHARAAIVPSSVALDAHLLDHAPLLRAVGRLSLGVENLDVDAFGRAGIEIVRPGASGANAEAEFAIGAMLQLLRRVPVRGSDGALVGRELGGATVGLVGVPPAAQPLATLLRAFGARVEGYDPSIHASDPLWAKWKIDAVGLGELLQHADVLCVLLGYFPRYRGLLGERFLGACKPNQVLVCLTQSNVFDEAALADALQSRRMLGAWFDAMDPSLLDADRPLHRVRNRLQITERLAGTTLQARARGAWSVVRRIDEILAADSPTPRAALSPDDADVPLDLEAGRASA